MKRCAILITEKNELFNKEEYDFFVGVEKGCLLVDSIESENKHYIGDFDSIEEEQKEYFCSLSNSSMMGHEEKEFSDGEEAIIYCLNNGFKPENIDVFVDESGRNDHYINMVLVSRKHSVNLIGTDMIVQIVQPGVETKIEKMFDIVSFTIVEPTLIKTDGLKWDIDGSYNLETTTNLISNEINGDYFTIKSDKKVIIIQSKN